jgi:hypothetical protein
VFREGLVGEEVFDEFHDLKALPRRKLEKGAQQAETFDRTICGRAELEMQFSREIQVFHLAPMTRIGFVVGPRGPDREPDAVTKPHGDDGLSAEAPGGLAR